MRSTKAMRDNIVLLEPMHEVGGDGAGGVPGSGDIRSERSPGGNSGCVASWESCVSSWRWCRWPACSIIQKRCAVCRRDEPIRSWSRTVSRRAR